MKGLIVAMLCMGFVSVGYAFVETKPEKEPVPQACVKTNTCTPPDVTPEPKDRTKTKHDGDRTH